jgi:hypothetical protein
MNFKRWFKKLFGQALLTEKPSDKWEGRIVRVDPPHIGYLSKTEYPFLAQIRQKGFTKGRWKDLEHKETCEEAEDAIRAFKARMDFKPTITFIKNVD